jgi:serine/threonine protein kinase
VPKDVKLLAEKEGEDIKSDVVDQRTNFTSKSLSLLVQGSIDNYSLGKVVGRGGYGCVREAVQKSSLEKVAIKVYEKSRVSELQSR